MIKRFKYWLPLMFGITLVLAGCGSTSGSRYKSGSFGPAAINQGQALGNKQQSYAYNKNIFLDVAIPVIDPGFPMKNNFPDDEKIKEEGIWPEVRRLEAKRYSINIRNAIQKTKAFGSVQVVPALGTPADLFVKGKIIESNTKDTRIRVRVDDATNKKWGEKTFSIETSDGFYRDSKNIGKDPNQQIYTDIANWVFALVQKKKTTDLENIQLVKEMRYAEAYSPEAFNSYLYESFGTVKLRALPADTDQMLTRVREYHAKDYAFLDSLQSSYDAFYVETNDAYRGYQEEALKVQVQLAEERADRIGNIFTGILATTVAVIAANQNSHLGNAGAVVGGLVAANSVRELLNNNTNIDEFEGVFDEMGQGLDIQISPQVRAFEEKEVELSGTAKEQYIQWRNHLADIYRATETPVRSL